jgi:hypothetical protein
MRMSCLLVVTLAVIIVGISAVYLYNSASQLREDRIGIITALKRA